MKLRIIAGGLKRRVIEFSGAAAEFRPTKSIVREAVADILQVRISGAIVADLCAGSGAFGFEMLSRGASQACFVENNKLRCARIRALAEQFAIGRQCTIIQKNVENFVHTCCERFDIVYYDPPYHQRHLIEALPNLIPLITADGIFVYERSKGYAVCDENLLDRYEHTMRMYGDTVIEIFSNKTNPAKLDKNPAVGD